MKRIKYKNFFFNLIWDDSTNLTTWLAYGNVNGQFLLVHTHASEGVCIAMMEEKIESDVIAHQI